MITLVGVGHVFAISGRVSDVIRSRRPVVVCLELDPVRYQSLLQRETTRRVPLQYSLLAMFQKRMADEFGSEVGDEMLAASSVAKEIGAKVALIDIDASRMLGTLWRRMSVKEKMGLFFGALVGLVSSKDAVEREIDAYQSNDEAYLEEIGRRFPAVKTVLIDDRNRIMAERIREIARAHGDVLAVVGDGHVPGIAKELAAEQPEVVRLKELMSPASASHGSGEYSVSFVWQQPDG